MNPFDEYRKSYIAACFTLAVIYAFILGGTISSDIMENLSTSNTDRLTINSTDRWSTGKSSLFEVATNKLIFCLADGFIYGIILLLTGIILWNIFRFAIPSGYTTKNRLIFLSILVIIAAISITGAESFAVYLCYPSMFDSFSTTIPSRLFFSFFIIIIIRLLYLFHHEKHFRNKEGTEGMLLFKEEVDVASTIPSIDRITVRSGQSIKIIPIDDIAFIKAEGDYISINTSKGYWLKEQTMKYTEDTLPADRFVRIHRSYIVNINHISRIERYGEQQQVVLHNNEKIKISAARYQVLKQAIRL